MDESLDVWVIPGHGRAPPPGHPTVPQIRRALSQHLHHHQAAVDGEDLAGDERGLVAGEEDDRSRDLLGLAESPERRRRASCSLSASGRSWVSSVSTKPGATALQVIVRLASSRALALVSPMTPAFADE